MGYFSYLKNRWVSGIDCFYTNFKYLVKICTEVIWNCYYFTAFLLLAVGLVTFSRLILSVISDIMVSESML